MFWDVFGEKGQPVRATVSEMGPLLLSRILELNDVQEGRLSVAFRAADEAGLLLLDLKDLRSDPRVGRRERRRLQREYGNVAGPSVGAIQRALLTLEDQGGDKLFGEPALDLSTSCAPTSTAAATSTCWPRTGSCSPRASYSTLLLWLLSRALRALPEVGDLDKPKLVFFFDEAHLLFDDAPPSLLARDRAGRPPDPQQGRRRLLRHAEPHGHPRRRPRSAGQQGPARAARVHAAATRRPSKRWRRPSGRTRPRRRDGRRPSSPSARRCVSVLDADGVRRRSSAPWSSRRTGGSARSRPSSASK